MRAAEDSRQVARMLFRRALRDDQWTDGAHAGGLQDRRVSCGAGILEIEALLRAPARAAMFVRPGRRNPSAFAQLFPPYGTRLSCGFETGGDAAGSAQLFGEGRIEKGLNTAPESGVRILAGRRLWPARAETAIHLPALLTLSQDET